MPMTPSEPYVPLSKSAITVPDYFDGINQIVEIMSPKAKATFWRFRNDISFSPRPHDYDTDMHIFTNWTQKNKQLYRQGDKCKISNKWDGRIISIERNSGLFIGYHRDKFAYGQGIHINEGGDIYFGEWTNNIFHGMGKVYYSSGNKYEGQWRDEKFDGHGVYTWVTGDKYVGEWTGG